MGIRLPPQYTFSATPSHVFFSAKPKTFISFLTKQKKSTKYKVPSCMVAVVGDVLLVVLVDSTADDGDVDTHGGWRRRELGQNWWSVLERCRKWSWATVVVIRQSWLAGCVLPLVCGRSCCRVRLILENLFAKLWCTICYNRACNPKMFGKFLWNRLTELLVLHSSGFLCFSCKYNNTTTYFQSVSFSQWRCRKFVVWGGCGWMMMRCSFTISEVTGFGFLTMAVFVSFRLFLPPWAQNIFYFMSQSYVEFI